MPSRVIQGDVFDVLPTLAPGSVDCCVTSPPYWMLRSYLPANHALKSRELGSEKTVGEYIGNMVRVFDMVKAALADHGTCWINVGDTYSSSGKSGGGDQGKKWNTAGPQPVGPRGGHWWRSPEFAEGNLCLIPQRLMIALQDAGWIVRSVVIWHKPAPMPTSVSGWMWRRCRVKTKSFYGPDNPHPSTEGNGKGGGSALNVHGAFNVARAEWKECDGCKKCKPHGGLVLRKGSWRPTSSYEPVIMLAKTADYFADGEPVKAPPKPATVGRDKYTRVIDDPEEQFAVKHDHETACIDGANLRDVWTIAAEPLKEKHYAAYPTLLVEKCLRAGTSVKGYCPACGMPWVRVVEGGAFIGDMNHSPEKANGVSRLAVDEWLRRRAENPARTTDWRPSCSCPPAESRPGLVLDPFGGSGRTAITAQQLGLDSVSVELNPEYAEMAKRLIRGDMPLFSGAT